MTLPLSCEIMPAAWETIDEYNMKYYDRKRGSYYK